MTKIRKPRTATVTRQLLLDEIRQTEELTSLNFEVHKEEFQDFELLETTTNTVVCTGTRKELYHYLKAYNTIHILNCCKNKTK